MKLRNILLLTALLFALSRASLARDILVPGLPKRLTGDSPTVTKNELAHQAVKLPPKIKLLRSNPHRFTAIRFKDINPFDAPDDESIIPASDQRPKLVHEYNWDPDLEISEYAKTRLAIARALAMAKYHEKWS